MEDSLESYLFTMAKKKVFKCADGKDRGTSQKRGEKKVLNLARYKVSKNCVAFKNLHSCKVIDRKLLAPFDPYAVFSLTSHI